MTTDPNTTARPYADADIHLIVTATEQHSISPGRPDADGHDPCSCGQWREGADGSSWDEHMAEVSLAALADAGRLVPAGGQWEWAVRLNSLRGRMSILPRDDEEHAHLFFAEPAGAENAEPVRRWVGPWLTAPAAEVKP